MPSKTVLTRRRLIGLAALGGLAACSKVEGGATDDAELLPALRKRGYVKVAYANEAPYGFREGGTLKGEAPALHGEVFKALGVPELRPVFSEWDGLIPGLLAGKYEVISAGMAILPDRCEKAAFSEPEFISPTAMMVPSGNPKKLTDLASAKRAGVTVGVMSGAAEKGYVRDAGIADGRIKTLTKPQDGADAVKSGRIDAFVLTGVSLRWLARTNKGLQVTEPFVPMIGGVKQYSPGGAVFRKTATSLRDAFNVQLKKITSDRERYVRLLGAYGFTAAELPPAGLSTARLCAA
ncbi:ectoine/hydroxyectoine ABC transporter substrate-binding protein EhuB [Streptomyces roseirectus]|uniref:Ectoine/hydroxyectoine ABC transporter substrate-binding protein EhuB n=1 Tax=Streptomyces roseirectus TaxID=2768066 RepID=A0A7H0I722_9ACTN|nr:ectoine/hydroxyectoine ABC transporter substrate-binding protein EhuB [Streptomyces roseirectus]QNP68588.1 ectoine/hydroxyectoine ABC transporter substrate-binding protein EhuB [Streptomyces roseirectus]